MSDGGDLRSMLAAALGEVPLHQLVDLRVVAAGDAGPAIMEIPVHANALGNGGGLHGGAIALLCDVACAVAASSASTYDVSTHILVTADLHVRYLGPAKGDVVRAEASVVKAGRTLVVVQADVTDGEGGAVAVADFSAMLVPHRKPLLQEGP
jgi:uncharacterized protein (TIGR00369 family)